MKQSYFPWVLSVFLVACLIFGGASDAGYFPNFLLQVSGAILIAWTAFFRRDHFPFLQANGFAWIAGLGLAIGLLQIMPLPFELWKSLPGREAINSELLLLGIEPSATFYSLNVYDSISSLAWGMPAVAVLVSAATFRESHRLVQIVVVFAFVSVALGLAQFFGPKDSQLYLYEFTSRGLMVGFFANANHMATLLLLAFPLLAALISMNLSRSQAARKEYVVLAALLSLALAIGVSLVGSITGYVLAGPAFLAGSLIVFRQARARMSLLFLPALILSAGILTLVEDSGNIFGDGSAADGAARSQMFKNTWQAATDYFPLGSGSGTFPEVYGRYVGPGEIGRSYVNHAHNDYLELFLELGLLGLVVMAAFLIWWSWRAYRIWSVEPKDPISEAAVLASGIILIHSIWDYPLRTVSLATIFALMCAIMAFGSGWRSPPNSSER